MRKWSLGLMTYKEVGPIPKDRSVLLLPIGWVEQHGPADFTYACEFVPAFLHLSVVAQRRAENPAAAFKPGR